MINHGTVVFDDSVVALKQQFLARKRIELKLVSREFDFGDTTVWRSSATTTSNWWWKWTRLRSRSKR